MKCSTKTHGAWHSISILSIMPVPTHDDTCMPTASLRKPQFRLRQIDENVGHWFPQASSCNGVTQSYVGTKRRLNLTNMSSRCFAAHRNPFAKLVKSPIGKPKPVGFDWKNAPYCLQS